MRVSQVKVSNLWSRSHCGHGSPERNPDTESLSVGEIIQFEEGLHRISISSILDRACLDMTNAVLRN